MKVRMADLYGKTKPLSIQQEELGALFEDQKGRLFEYTQYNDGDGNIPGLRGMICYDVVVDAANISNSFQVTCDITQGTIVSGEEFSGVIIPDVVLHNQYCWKQISGIGLVDMWAVAAQTRTTDTYTNHLIPHTVDGVGVVAAAGSEHLQYATILADINGVPTGATGRYIVGIPAGNITAGTNFAVAELVSGGTSSDGGTVVKVLKSGITDYGLILSTLTGSAVYFQAAETLTGATSGATGLVGVIGYAVFAANYKLKKM